MNANIIGLSILLLSVGLVIGKMIRLKFKIFSTFFLPSSIIAGFIFLFLGNEVLGRIFGQFDALSHLEYGLFSKGIMEVFSSLPGLLISVIFASLFIGKKIPKFKEIWIVAGPQVSYGQTVAWGQYVLGTFIALVFLVPVLGASPLTGALIEISFVGGHGTAAGLADTFSELGFSEGRDLALGLATVGVVSGVILGVVLINWGVRKNKTNYLKDPKGFDENELRGIIDEEKRESGGKISVSPQSIEPLAFHLGLIGIAVIIGQGLLELLIFIENVTWGANDGFIVMAYVPLFPLAMVGGVIVELLVMKFDNHNLVNREMINRLQGLALDFLIISAIASLSLTVIGENIVVFIILSLIAIVWNVFTFIYLAPKMIPKNWFERGIGDFGQSMGMTAAGLMLIRIVDSKKDTEALEAFGYKQLLFEPFVGGGLMTAASVPLIYNFGLLPILIFVTIVMMFWLLLGLLYFGKKDLSNED